MSSEEDRGPESIPKFGQEDEQSALPIGKFRIPKVKLNNIAYATQDREFSEEVDKLEQNGGEKWIEVFDLINYRMVS